MTTPFTLNAIDGSNPLGFLAAIGTLRLAALEWPESDISLHWYQASSWTPILSGCPESDEYSLCSALLQAPAVPIEDLMMLGKNITVAPGKFREFTAKALNQTSLKDRRMGDFAAAFGCEDCQDEKNERIRYTQLCFITGSGHQDFLGTIAALREVVSVERIYEALFGGWQCSDKSFSFRWDPSDAREYALRWSDPSKEGAWTTWGANRLAFEALPLFPTQPQKDRLSTTAFASRRSEGQPRRDELTWPMWAHPLGVDEIKSLLSLTELQAALESTDERAQKENAQTREHLKARGIEEIFRATRIRIGQGANFKVSFRPARAI